MQNVTNNVLPGARTTKLIIVPDGGSAAVEVPVHTIAGERAGANLAVVGGVHGDEYDGIRAAQLLASRLSPCDLQGSLTIIPIANPSAYRAGQRRSAIDDADLNRSFPGNPNGEYSQKLAYALSQTLRGMDLVFTLHGGSAPMRLAPYLEYFHARTTVGERSHAAAQASGFPNIIAIPKETQDSPLKGCLLPGLGNLGIPVIEGEVGGRGELRPTNVEYYIVRVKCVMAHLGMIAAPLIDAPSRQRSFQILDQHAPSAGLMQRDVELDQLVQPGERLATLLDISGEVVAEIRSPIQAVIGGYREDCWINEGQVAIRLFDPINERS